MLCVGTSSPPLRGDVFVDGRRAWERGAGEPNRSALAPPPHLPVAVVSTPEGGIVAAARGESPPLRIHAVPGGRRVPGRTPLPDPPRPGRRRPEAPEGRRTHLRRLGRRGRGPTGQPVPPAARPGSPGVRPRPPGDLGRRRGA